MQDATLSRAAAADIYIGVAADVRLPAGARCRQQKIKKQTDTLALTS